MKTAVFALLCVGAAQTPALASIHTVSRINDYSMSFADTYFNNTLFHLSVRQDRTADTPGDSTVESFAVLPNSTGVVWTGFDGVSVTNVMVSPATVSATISSPNALPGYSQLLYDSPPDQNAIFIGSASNRFFLRITLTSGGGVDLGSPSQWHMTLPGDWSSQGIGLMQHELVTYNPAWTLDSNFVFDPQSNSTLLALSTSSYSVPPSVQFILHGATVPGPGAASILGAAGVLPLLNRRRRS